MGKIKLNLIFIKIKINFNFYSNNDSKLYFFLGNKFNKSNSNP
jgi:hypothetical protein